MTAYEERARRLIAETLCDRDDIAAAIREAEDAALERAAALVSDGKPVEGIQTIIVGKHYAQAIRALKAQQLPKKEG